jgi:hypothetical protein
MNIGKACAIFQQIDSDKYTDEEKGTAIYDVLKMPTHNGITKDQMLKVINYLLGLAFELPEHPQNRPPEIVCLIGSTRFYEEYQQANFELTMQGKIVLTVGFYPHSQEKAHSQNVGCTPEQKIALDELHKRKIDLADRVLVLNVGGYIGDSTRSEIEYTEAHGKPVIYWETKEANHEES